MKIDAVDLTLFAWDDIPPTRYSQGSQNTSGRSNLGLLRINTDAGIEGHAFLGSATNPAETDANALIRFLKPILMGRDPRARDDLHAAMRARQRVAGLRVIGACDTALWDISAKAAGVPLYRLLGSDRSAIGAYASSQILDSREARWSRRGRRSRASEPRTAAMSRRRRVATASAISTVRSEPTTRTRARPIRTPSCSARARANRQSSTSWGMR